MKEEVVRSKATLDHWLITEKNENGVKLKNFQGQTMFQDWSTFNSWFEYPSY